MCFDSSSSSASASTTNNNDKRVAVDNGAFGLSGDSNIVHVSTTTTATDAGAIKAGAEIAQAALVLGGNAIHDTLAANVQTTQAVLNANGDATKNALAFGGAAVNAVGTANATALQFADKASSNALALANKSQSMAFSSAADSLGFGQHVVDMAFAAQKSAQEVVATAGAQVAQAYDTATNYQAQKSTTDSRYLVIAGMIVIALFALKVVK